MYFFGHRVTSEKYSESTLL
uniref:Uncharacterized protein n=1 Tax=Anguilla anguilla TaxID=7936 RepID=A0A0E9RM26_ANGAN